MDNMTDDVQLLRRYAEDGSEAAFADLVRGHVNLVYSAALRWTGRDTHLAQDVTQSVFSDLARKARSLPRSIILAGWLYQATRFAAAKVVRTERRRVNREQEAVAMQEQTRESPTDWEQISPHLDEAMSSLPAADRDAVLLRFFERKEFREVGIAIGSTEEAARKRVTRALDKLRAALSQKGVPVSSTALAAALIAGAVESAPAAIVTTVTATAVSSAVASGTTLTVLKLMSLTNLKIAVAGTAVIAGLATPLVIQHQKLNNLRSENTGLQQKIEQLDASQAEQPATPKVDAAEIDRLRTQNSELLRLRAEVAKLRNEKADADKLRAENAKLRESTKKMAAVQPPTPTTEEEQREKEENMARMNDSKQWALASIMFAQDNNGMLPNDFKDARTYKDPNSPINSAEDSVFELLTSGKLTSITNPSQTVLLREREPRRTSHGNYLRTYAFVDGHSEVLSSPDGSYEDLEKIRGFNFGQK